MRSHFSIRLAVAEDLPSLGSIQDASGSLFSLDQVPKPPPIPTAVDFGPALHAGCLLVALVGRTLVGFALAEILGDSLHLSQVSVLPDFGQRGIGRSLVTRIVETARERQFPAVTLTTFRDVPWNGPFYASMGFREIPRAQLSAELQGHIERDEGVGLSNRVAMELRIDA